MTTRFIRNALAVSPLAAGIATVERVRPFWCEHLPAHLTDLGAGRRSQTPLFQLLPITNIAAFLVVAVFFGPDARVKNAPAALTYDSADRGHRLILTAELPVIILLHNILVLVLPIAIPHGFLTSFVMEKSGPQHLRPAP